MLRPAKTGAASRPGGQDTNCTAALLSPAALPTSVFPEPLTICWVLKFFSCSTLWFFSVSAHLLRDLFTFSDCEPPRLTDGLSLPWALLVIPFCLHVPLPIMVLAREKTRLFFSLSFCLNTGMGVVYCFFG